jgi:hypothetical protein
MLSALSITRAPCGTPTKSDGAFALSKELYDAIRQAKPRHDLAPALAVLEKAWPFTADFIGAVGLTEDS